MGSSTKWIGRRNLKNENFEVHIDDCTLTENGVDVFYSNRHNKGNLYTRDNFTKFTGQNVSIGNSLDRICIVVMVPVYNT